MTKKENQIKTIEEIKTLMERSSRFISLSGISGVSAGIFALIGCIIAIIFLNNIVFSDIIYTNCNNYFDINDNYFAFFLINSLSVLIFSIFSGIYFTTKNARKKNLKIWDKTTKLILINLFIPLLVGGIFCIALIFYQIILLIIPSMLIFYGLALINASKFTFNDVKQLGYIELLIGLAACFFVKYGLVAWALGFGIAHIIYGIKVYYKYEK